MDGRGHEVIATRVATFGATWAPGHPVDWPSRPSILTDFAPPAAGAAVRAPVPQSEPGYSGPADSKEPVAHGLNTFPQVRGVFVDVSPVCSNPGCHRFIDDSLIDSPERWPLVRVVQRAGCSGSAWLGDYPSERLSVGRDRAGSLPAQAPRAFPTRSFVPNLDAASEQGVVAAAGTQPGIGALWGPSSLASTQATDSSVPSLFRHEG